LFSYFWGIYALKNENSLDFLFLLHQGKRKREINSLDFLVPLEKLFSVSIIMPSLRDCAKMVEKLKVFFNPSTSSTLQLFSSPPFEN